MMRTAQDGEGATLQTLMKTKVQVWTQILPRLLLLFLNFLNTKNFFNLTCVIIQLSTSFLRPTYNYGR